MDNSDVTSHPHSFSCLVSLQITFAPARCEPETIGELWAEPSDGIQTHRPHQVADEYLADGDCSLESGCGQNTADPRQGVAGSVCGPDKTGLQYIVQGKKTKKL